MRVSQVNHVAAAAWLPQLGRSDSGSPANNHALGLTKMGNRGLPQ
jgi:hypothetical protein